MVAVGMSEFTFGFAFLYEQTLRNWGQLQAVPILPSLQREADVGWDARLPLVGTDYYYQFKLSDYLSRGNAKYIGDGIYNSPYYRLKLHRRDGNRQHRRLRLHARTNPKTYYAAPEFSRIDEFNSAFLARQIADRSRLIPLTDCDDIDDGEQHYITYQKGSRAWLQHSEPKGHTKSYFGRELESLYGESASEWQEIDINFSLNKLRQATAAVREVELSEATENVEPALPLPEFDAQPQGRSAVLMRTSQILAVVFGVTMVIVGERRADRNR